MKKTKLIRRIGSAILAAAVCVTSLFADINVQKAEAATKNSWVQEVTVNSAFQAVDGKPFCWFIGFDDNGYSAFCARKGVDSPTGVTYTSSQGYSGLVTKSASFYAALAEYYGYPNHAQYKVTDAANAYKETDLFCATQAVIWEILGDSTHPTPYRNLPFDTDYNNIDTSGFTLNSGTSFRSLCAKISTNCVAIYDQIVSDIQKHTQRMSFAGTEADPTKYTMQYDNAKKCWTLSLSDSNNQISNFSNFKSSLEAQGYSVTVNGTSVTITAPESKQGKSDVIKFKKDWAFMTADVPVIWKSSVYQDILQPSIVLADPIGAAIQLETPTTKGVVSVQKIDPDSNPLSGAKFTISYAEAFTDPNGVAHTAGEEVVTSENPLVTGEDGKAQTDDNTTLYIGAKYNLTEIAAPAGHILVSAPTTFEYNTETDRFSADHTYIYKEFKPVNTPTETHVSKKAATGDNELVGAHLQLFEGTSLIEEWDSTKDQHVIYGLKFNTTYTLKETIAPNGYKLAASKDFHINDDGSVTTVTMIDEYQTGDITVQKRTEGMINIEGIEIELKGTSDVGLNVQQTQFTDANGKATFSYVPVGTYTLTEKESDATIGYLISDPKTVTVKNAQTSEVEFFNDYKSGTIELKKRTEGGNDIEGIDFILEGTADIGLTVKKTATTDKDGKATFTKIPVGTYTITEDGETVPAAYLTAEPQSVTVKYAETTDAEFFNDVKRGDISIQKRTEGGNDIEGIKFILSGTSDAGTEVKAEATTDKDGKASFEKIPVGTYTITEDGETVPAAYLTAESQKVTVKYAETTDAEFFNDYKKGDIHLQKRTEGMVYISGITFILEGTSDAGEAIKRTATTDKDGVAVFEDIPIGTYTITEDGSTVPTGFLTAEPQKVTVTYAETSDVEFVNKPTSTDDVPQTGKVQNSAAALSIGAVLAALAAAGVVLSKKRRAR